MFFFLFFWFLTNYSPRQPTKANDSQRRPTTANAGQRRPTMANDDQQRPAQASDRIMVGPNDVIRRLGPGMFYFHTFTLLLIIYMYIGFIGPTQASVGPRRPTTTNAGQRGPTTANVGQHRPTKTHDRQRRPTMANTG